MFTQSCIFVKIPNKSKRSVSQGCQQSQSRLKHVTLREIQHKTHNDRHRMNDCFRRNYQVMDKLLTRMSSFPLSSRVQYVLGPLPSRRVCLQVILFSVSHVTRLCGQLQAISQQPFEDEHLYLHVLLTRRTFIFSQRNSSVHLHLNYDVH